MDWVPAYLDLWVDDKADLSHATRSIFLRLCHAARRARRDGLVPLPPSSASDEAGVLAIVHGKPAETKAAIAEMLTHGMVDFEDCENGRAVRVLSWENWTLTGRPDETESEETPAPARRSGRPRKWASEADRSRARRVTATGNQVGERPETRPETNPVATGNPTGNETGYQFPVVGGEGGRSEIRSDQKTAERNEESAREQVVAVPATGAPVGTGGQLDLLADGRGRPASAKRARRERPATPPSPVTEVQALWRTEWSAAGMPGPAPWDAAAASATKTYLEAPGATLETARAALVGMLRTPAGHWHRTTEGGRHATAQAALTGKHVVSFTADGTKWLAAQRAASTPKRQPPPPEPVPDYEAIRRKQAEAVSKAWHVENGTAEVTEP
jgi:hypothetical protein